MCPKPDDLIIEVSRLVPLINALARRSVQDGAEDLAQDVLTTAIEQIRRGRFRSESTVSTWTIGIFRNRLLAVRRMRRRESGVVLYGDSGDGALTGPADTETCYNLRLIIERAVRELPGFQRHVVFRKAEGHSSESIARETGVSPDFVDRQFNVARKALRKLLTDEALSVLCTKAAK